MLSGNSDLSLTPEGTNASPTSSTDVSNWGIYTWTSLRVTSYNSAATGSKNIANIKRIDFYINFLGRVKLLKTIMHVNMHF